MPTAEELHDFDIERAVARAAAVARWRMRYRNRRRNVALRVRMIHLRRMW